MKNIKQFVFTLCAMLLAGTSVKAQETKTEEVQRWVRSKNYVFEAQTVIPQSGQSRILTPGYELAVAADKIESYLPYFGRAYTAPVNPSEGGIKFTSADFEYKISPDGRKWEILIKPKDIHDVQQLYLTIFDNGKATLNVTSNNRQAISFHGYIKEGVNKKKAF